MKKQIVQLTLALTSIYMYSVTKWWYTLPVDGPDKLYWGFPIAFMGEGFHTSMSLQFFVLDFMADFLLYFTLVLWLVLAFTKWFPAVQIPKKVTKIVWVLSLVLLIGLSLIVSTSNPIIKITRNYDWKVLKTGSVYLWQKTPRPERNILAP